MRRTCLWVVTIGLLAASSPLLGGGKDTGEDALKKVQGTWKFLSHEMNGQPTPREEVEKLKISFSGDKFSVTEDGKVLQAGTNKLDPTKKPAHIDATVTDGQGKGVTMLGVYELKGDTLRVCFDPTGKQRPTGLTPKDGQCGAVIQREKKSP
jgi:uncharacterized protein (TIGR03067 family)